MQNGKKKQTHKQKQTKNLKNLKTPKPQPNAHQKTAMEFLKNEQLLNNDLTRREANVGFSSSQDMNEVAKGNFVLKYPEYLEFLIRLGDLKYAEDDVYATTGARRYDTIRCDKIR